MSARKPTKVACCSAAGEPATSTNQEQKKLRAEVTLVRERIERLIHDRPQIAKKAALIVELWLRGEAKPKKRANTK